MGELCASYFYIPYPLLVSPPLFGKALSQQEPISKSIPPNSNANLFVAYMENEFFSNYNGPTLDLYKLFIDDCVGATSSSKEELNQFTTSVNSFHPALKYTREISENSACFPRH